MGLTAVQPNPNRMETLPCTDTYRRPERSGRQCSASALSSSHPGRGGDRSRGPKGSGSLRVEISASDKARVVGDHETVTVANTGPAPQRDVLAMLSLVDVTGSLAAPLGLEDWTAAPEAAHASQLLPGASVGRT